MTSQRDSPNTKLTRLRKSFSSFCDSGIKAPFLRGGMSSLFCIKSKVANLEETDLDFLAEHTACDKETLKVQFEHFIEKHPNGAISKKDFRTLMKKCFPERDFRVLEKRIFNMYDENRDGSISFRELMLVMYIMSSGTPEQNLKQIFRIFDANGNGTISRKEMKKLIEDMFHLLDLDQKPKDEMNKKTLIESAMNEMDTNQDGQVSEAEFVQAIMSHQKVAKLLALKVVQVFDPDVTQERLT